jgi:dipeptidyl-peptidase-3
MIDRFYDISVLSYRVPEFDSLSLERKKFIFYLSLASAWGRDIIYDQNCMINLPLRHTLEDLVNVVDKKKNTDFYDYLKCFYAHNGIHHHYNEVKIVPRFTKEWFTKMVKKHSEYFKNAPELLKDSIIRALFDPEYLPVRTCHETGKDLLLNSANNLYFGVTEQEAKDFYGEDTERALNSRLVKNMAGEIVEEKYMVGGRYDFYILQIIDNLKKAREFAENENQRSVIDALVKFYQTGDIKDFNDYSIAWVKETDSKIDFINGFIEVYIDALGFKGSWEGLVEIQDEEKTALTQLLSEHAQWFEDNSPTDKKYKKAKCRGISSKAVTAAFLGGDEYPLTAIGINLPNATWIRTQHGSKSVTLTNIINAYSEEEARTENFLKEFYLPEQIELIKKYSKFTGTLHTSLHECLGHGSGQLLKGVDKTSLKEFGSVIEETRADLFGLYYLADKKMVDLGLLPDTEAYKAEYIKYLVSGLFTQLSRLPYDATALEEAHMKNRMLICQYALEWNKRCGTFMEISDDYKVNITDFQELRKCFGDLLAKIQEITSTGNYGWAQRMVQLYTGIDTNVLKNVKERYDKLDIPPFRVFVNPWYNAVYNVNHKLIDIKLVYETDFLRQNLMYSELFSGVI